MYVFSRRWQKSKVGKSRASFIYYYNPIYGGGAYKSLSAHHCPFFCAFVAQNISLNAAVEKLL
jgi:hypothetical protein